MCLSLQLQPLGYSAQRGVEVAQREGLEQVVVRSPLQYPHSAVDAPLAGHQDGSDRVGALPDGREQLRTRHARHLHVRQHHVDAALLQQIQSFDTVGSHTDRVPAGSQVLAQKFDDAALVVNHENRVVVQVHGLTIARWCYAELLAGGDRWLV